MDKPLGTFAGVFRPTVLTILGALLYLRGGWLVGHAGLLGALAVIAGAVVITGATALSVATIATNQRVRPGGAFAIISQALGLEAGGAIGGPLYVAQALSAARYAYAFAEALQDTVRVMGGPELSLVPVALVAFLAVAGVTLKSTALAVKAQGALFVLALVALASLFSGVFTEDLSAPALLPPETDVSLLDAFALFFPAVTGIMVGVGMSGRLANPQRAIPRGTMGAWCATTAVYVLGMVFYALVASPTELMAPGTVAFDKALIGPVVRIGLLASTLMASLSCLVASSQLLQAMAHAEVVPRAAEDGQRALVITVVVASLGLLTGSLDAIAPIITAFFLLTYLAVNAVVLLEQRLGMISFRPTFKVSGTVPVVGLVASMVGLALASPALVLVAGVAALGLVYAYLSRKNLQADFETVHSGVPVALATWAARRASRAERTRRAWKPDLLAAVQGDDTATVYPLVRTLAGRHGSIRLMAMGTRTVPEEVEQLRERLQRNGLFCTTLSVSEAELGRSFSTALEAMQGDLFPPNLVVLNLARASQEDLDAVREECHALKLGLAVFAPTSPSPLGDRQTVDVWLSDRGDDDWAPRLHDANLDLPILAGLLATQAWNGELNLVTCVPDETGPAQDFLDEVARTARLECNRHVLRGAFMEQLRRRAPADLHVFGLPPSPRRDELLDLATASGGACLWVMDSGKESAFA